MKNINLILEGDSLKVLKTIESESVDCIITSPPYWGLRDYGMKGQLGLERSFDEYIQKLCDIFDEVKRVLKNDGTCWVNIADTYSSVHYGGTPSAKAQVSSRVMRTQKFAQTKAKGQLPDKCLCNIPARFAIEMTSRGWILRNEIIWQKPNAMPSSATDRFTVDFEKIFFFVKSRKYNFVQAKEKAKWAHDKRATSGRLHYEGGKRLGAKGSGQENFVSIKQERNVRTVWNISTTKFKEAHFATFPEALVLPMIQAGCPVGGIVLDPFIGGDDRCRRIETWPSVSWHRAQSGIYKNRSQAH